MHASTLHYSPLLKQTPNFLRFFETEATAILALLISRYKVSIKEEPQFAGETFEQRKERILRARPGVTLTYVTRL